MLPLPAVRAVHPGPGGVEQIITTVAVPMLAADIDRPEIPATLKRAGRALQPYRTDWRHSNPFVLAGQAHSRAAKVWLSVCLGLCEIYHRHCF